MSPGRFLVALAMASAIVFWTWALFFAPKESINKIEDRAWAERAEAICAVTKVELSEFDSVTSSDSEVRAVLVVDSTDLLAAMLDDIVAVQPTDEKGQAIVPDWEAEYRILLQDRYNYAERIRAGDEGPFTETAIQSIPITERIVTFAADNEMSSCAPPQNPVN